MVERAKKLRMADDKQALSQLAAERVKEAQERGDESVAGKALTSLFSTDSRDDFITPLGVSKTEIALKVAEAVENLKVSHGSRLEDNNPTLPKSPIESESTSQIPSHTSQSFLLRNPTLRVRSTPRGLSSKRSLKSAWERRTRQVCATLPMAN